MGQMTGGKTAWHRIAGFAKSERLDAKFFLLAVAPFVPVMVSDELGWSRGVLWHMWCWLSVVWALVIVGVGFDRVDPVCLKVEIQGESTMKRS